MLGGAWAGEQEKAVERLAEQGCAVDADIQLRVRRSFDAGVRPLACRALLSEFCAEQHWTLLGSIAGERGVSAEPCKQRGKRRVPRCLHELTLSW